MKLTSLQIKKTLASPEELLDKNKVWTQVSTDTRVSAPGALFVALVGESFDAHNFIAQAVAQGCHGLVVEKDIASALTPEQRQSIQVFTVKDTLWALQQLAHIQSQSLKQCLKVAITGTSGKTSTKYFAHQLLQDEVKHYFSPKSFNNHIGVPLSVLEIDEEDKVALLEVGMNHPGEIENLISIIEPDVTLVTMVGRGHLLGLGSIEAVLKEKMSIYSKGQTHIVNMDDARIYEFYKNKRGALKDKAQVCWVSSKNADADIFLSASEDPDDPFGKFIVKGHVGGVKGEAQVPISGLHHVTNVLMAVAIAFKSGLSAEKIWQRLGLLRSFWGRSEVIRSPQGHNFYFDAYNANPESMKAFLLQLQKLQNPPFIILGEMLELGDDAQELHYELGLLAAKIPHEQLWFMGPSHEAFLRGYSSQKNGKTPVISDAYKEDVALRYKSMLKTGDWIALKGSRGMRLESFLTLFEGVELH